MTGRRMRFGVIFVTLALTQSVHGWIRPKGLDQIISLGMVSAIKETAKRVSDSVTNKERTREELKIGIAGFYDRSSQLWESVWGEHMHHGKKAFDSNISSRLTLRRQDDCRVSYLSSLCLDQDIMFLRIARIISKHRST